MKILLKRIYEPASPDDGFRVLVDRLWPRGVAKADAGVDLWLKEAAPSNELRKWSGHDPAKWKEFKKRYFAELDSNQDALAPIIEARGKRVITFLFAARDEHHNNAVALKAYVESNI